MDLLVLWLSFIAVIRIIITFKLAFDQKYILDKSYNLVRNQFTPITFRAFFFWALNNSILTILMIFNMDNKPLFILTILASVTSVTHHVSEHFIFKSNSFKNIILQLCCCVPTIIWMSLRLINW